MNTDLNTSSVSLIQMLLKVFLNNQVTELLNKGKTDMTVKIFIGVDSIEPPAVRLSSAHFCSYYFA